MPFNSLVGWDIVKFGLNLITHWLIYSRDLITCNLYLSYIFEISLNLDSDLRYASLILSCSFFDESISSSSIIIRCFNVSIEFSPVYLLIRAMLFFSIDSHFSLAQFCRLFLVRVALSWFLVWPQYLCAFGITNHILKICWSGVIMLLNIILLFITSFAFWILLFSFSSFSYFLDQFYRVL